MEGIHAFWGCRVCPLARGPTKALERQDEQVTRTGVGEWRRHFMVSKRGRWRQVRRPVHSSTVPGSHLAQRGLVGFKLVSGDPAG